MEKMDIKRMMDSSTGNNFVIRGINVHCFFYLSMFKLFSRSAEEIDNSESRSKFVNNINCRNWKVSTQFIHNRLKCKLLNCVSLVLHS